MSGFTTQDGNTIIVEPRLAADGSIVDESLSASAPAQNDDAARTDVHTGDGGQPILYVAALLSVSAASIHALVVPEHFGEWWGYGVFFLAAAVLQTTFAVVLIRRPSRPVLAAGIVGNLAIVAVWIISRSVGVPFFGPGAGEVEAIGLHDVISTAAEVVLVMLLFLVAWSFDRFDSLIRAES